MKMDNIGQDEELELRVILKDKHIIKDFNDIKASIKKEIGLTENADILRIMIHRYAQELVNK